MQPFPTTIIYRHKRENKKKCSLEPLVSDPQFEFFTYPTHELPTLENHFILSLDGPLLSRKDSEKGLILIDGTWKYAEKMFQSAAKKQSFPLRSLPTHFETAYPRKQTECSDPKRGLASIEALYIAYLILGRNVDGLLDKYYWKDQFLEINKQQLKEISHLT